MKVRASISAATLAIGLLAAAPAVSTAEAASARPAPTTPSQVTTARQMAARALSTAQAALRGDATGDENVDATLALRDLFMQRDQLRGRQAKQADALMARPTDKTENTFGSDLAYGKRPVYNRCSATVCVHWVKTGKHAATTKWARKTLAVMTRVYTFETTTLGYRKPLKDGRRGGNNKVDVYLNQIGSLGLYGYCNTEKASRRFRYTATAYCVLDNNFSAGEYGAPPMKSLTVTAAHEFFHAVQFAYDYAEDSWLMEGTSTWMEERFDDASNDNRNYLGDGMLQHPDRSLDASNGGPDGLGVYGNWIFFEQLSQEFGDNIVKQIWDRAGAGRGMPDMYSTEAIDAALGINSSSLATQFAHFGAANGSPETWYSEGDEWGVAPDFVVNNPALANTYSKTTTLNHLTYDNYAFAPSPVLGSAAVLGIDVDASNGTPDTVVIVTVYPTAATPIQNVATPDQNQEFHTLVQFGYGVIDKVIVTVANGSRAMSGCFQDQTEFACHGSAVDDFSPYSLQVSP